jgi:3-oxoacyl-[acyl-carrier protein] reductase
MSIELNLRDKVAIIGGASKGLGYASAEALVKQGANIIITGRNSDSLKQASIELSKYGTTVYTLNGDMSDNKFNERIIDFVINKFGRLDILVNNSGGPKGGNYSNFSDSDWTNGFHSVLMYNIRMTSLSIEIMKKNQWGRIINIASLSVKEPAESLVISNVFRAGVIAFAKSISKELIKSNITINNLCPGAFRTDRAIDLMSQAAAVRGISISELENENIKKLPLGRYQDSEELGFFVAYLCSDYCRGLTGTTIQLDGGISNSLL